ncbi:MAG: ABC transporter ATP-binding protein/permease [Oscillospiraceae bacterium]|nr:ABC transporter ATP-binding protein/permease [Oscillospiraceae bacterium]
MLQIQNIRKQYKTGDLVQVALDGVSLTLRDNEFVAILGPSGSGKTTLLNVIGGLDRYDSGDLVINGISTKKYTDRDWDSYRNHTIGFVFQSYNLIPHQTVLANVELALTISGISRAERKRRAKAALESVGLGNQLHKRPNQMSGGQMQRVAIARALVNNPDILLADEPTGALDSDTSVQIMELLKEVARDRLVVMVTHNPELAEEYANRIVRVKDGRIIDDTNPYVPGEAMEAAHKNMGHSAMSIFTAFGLSFNNLLTKKARTLLTAFAGSIGIIGIALILALSTGFQAYIDKIQEDTLSNYPLSIQSDTADIASAFMSIGAQVMDSQNADEGVVKESQMITQVMGQMGSNDLRSFKKHLDLNYDQVKDTINYLDYSYGITPLIYAADTTERITQVNPASLFADLTGSAAMSAYMDSNMFYEMMDDRELLNEQYEVLTGRWPEHYNEMIMVLGDPHMFTDYMAYTLGMRDPAELESMIDQLMEGKEPTVTTKPMSWTYDELMALDFRLVMPTDLYQFNEEYEVWENLSEDKVHLRQTIADAEKLKIVGIVCPKSGGGAAALSQGIAYTPALIDHIIEEAGKTRIVRDQIAHPKTDVFTGKEFGADTEEEGSGLNFQDMISIDEELLKEAFGGGVDAEGAMTTVQEHMSTISMSLDADTRPAQTALTETLTAMANAMLTDYIVENANPETGIAMLAPGDSDRIAAEYLATEDAQKMLEALAEGQVVPADGFYALYRPLLGGMLTMYSSAVIEMTKTEEPQEGVTLPGLDGIVGTLPLPEFDFPLEPNMTAAPITQALVEPLSKLYPMIPAVSGGMAEMAIAMVEGNMQLSVMTEVGQMTATIVETFTQAFNVDPEKMAAAFQFDLSEEELSRLMAAMTTGPREHSYESNLRGLGYADLEDPSAISIYFVDFAGKEVFLDFLDRYNDDMEARGKEDQVISYTDLTGIMMSSVKTIIDSVSYVLIAFVSVSLIVSSIMIGIITYISVMERTKEIGVLRAIGASKRNISQVFNAETFIIGLCSGLIGVGVTWLLIFPINEVIHSVAGNPDINAVLPLNAAMILAALSVVLTIVGGLIPSKKAAQKDPVIALRSE